MNKQIRKQTKNKLKSETGASILIALLVFLIAAMTGSVILTSATVSSGAVHRSTEQNKNMSLLKSASKVLIDGFEKESDINISDNQNENSNSSTTLNSIKELQTYMAQYVYDNNEECTYDISSMKLNQNTDNNSQTVSATVTMDLDYSVSIDLQTKGKKNNGDESHLYVRFNGDPTGSNTDVDETSDTLKIQQSDPIITTVPVKEADDNGQTNG